MKAVSLDTKPAQMIKNNEGRPNATAKKYVITGGPAIGKTEVVKELNTRSATARCAGGNLKRQ